MEKMRDSIDFKNMDIAALFRKLLLPTLLLLSILWLHYGYFLPVSV